MSHGKFPCKTNPASTSHAEKYSGIPASLGAGARGPGSVTSAVARSMVIGMLWLAMTLQPALPILAAAEIPPDQPEPTVTEPTPETAQESPPAATPDSEEAAKDAWAQIQHWQRFHQIGLFASGEFSYFGRDLSAQAVRWTGTRLPQMEDHRLRTTLFSARIFLRIESDNRERDGQTDGMRYFLLATDELRTHWRDGGGSQFDLSWQSLRAAVLHGHGGVRSGWLIPSAGIAYPFEFGIAWDHLALRQAGTPTRYRDGVRLALGVAHLEGSIWTPVGISIGAKLDFNLGAGLLGDRLYGTAALEFEPRLGLNFLRGREEGCDIPFGGIYIGAKTGGRWLWAAGPHAMRLQNLWAFQPNLTVQLYF